MKSFEECRELSDAVLSKDLRFLAARDHHGLAVLLAHLGEFDRRQLSVKESGISLFTHCVRVLGYDEFDAYRRIRAARSAAKHPLILDLVDQGRLTLTAIVLLAPHLDESNHRAWLEKACGKSRRQIEALIAARHPQENRPDFVRRHPLDVRFAPAAPPHAVDVLPAGGVPPPRPVYPAVDSTVSPEEATRVPVPEPAPAHSRPHEWQAVVAISIDRVRIGFDADVRVMRLIDRARVVLGHKYPAGRLEDVVRDALEVFLDRKDPQRRLTLKPAPLVREGTPPPAREPAFLRDTKAGRYIPMRVKSAVWQRDGGRCAWRFPDGTLCGSKERVEYDHVRPFAKGGRSDSPRNVRLLCRAHNQLRAAEAGLSAPSSSGSSSGAGARPASGGSA